MPQRQYRQSRGRGRGRSYGGPAAGRKAGRGPCYAEDDSKTERGAAPVNAIGLLHLAAVAAAAIPETASAATDDKACKTASTARSCHFAAACAASVAAPNGPGPPHAGGPQNPIAAA